MGCAQIIKILNFKFKSPVIPYSIQYLCLSVPPMATPADPVAPTDEDLKILHAIEHRIAANAAKVNS